MTLPLRSMAGRLVLGLFAGAVVVLPLTGLFVYQEVGDMVISSVDRLLHSKRQLLTGLLHEEHGGIEFELSEIVAGEYVIPRSGHYYRVTSGAVLVAASPSLVDTDFVFAGAPSPGPALRDGELIYTSTGPDNEPVRVLHYRYPAFDMVFEITLAESISDGLAMMETFKRYLLGVVPLAVAALCLLGWRIARVSLRPLEAFSATIETITHRTLSSRIDDKKTVRELAGLARAFNTMLDRLNRVFESQKRLVADASHEMKTPLSVIKTECDVILQRPRSAAEYGEALRSIQASSRSMTRLINDLLSLARLDAGLLPEGKPAVCSVRDCVEQAAAVTAALAAERGIRVSVTCGETPSLLGSCSGLVEAFVNLLENAVKYNRDGGTVDATVESRGERILITVADTGMGIAKEDRDRIFERFYRASAARTKEGTGLGLSIVKSVIEAHNGTIRVESEAGSGARFIIELPKTKGAS